MVNIPELGNRLIMDVIRYETDFYIHKQIEKRDGRLYIRLKKRSYVENT